MSEKDGITHPMRQGSGPDAIDDLGTACDGPRLRSRSMDDLASDYLGHLVDRAAAIRAALDAFDAPRLRRLAHDVAGTAGGYGFDRVGDAALALEGRIRAVLREVRNDATCPMDEKAISEIRETTERLLETCDAAIRRGFPR